MALLIQRCELMRWNGSAARCNVLDYARNTPLHTCIRQAHTAPPKDLNPHWIRD